MNNEDFIGICPTCEKICKQIGMNSNWWRCSHCTWTWEPQDKVKLVDRVSEREQRSILSDEIYAGADVINHPAHYGAGTYEAINVIEAWDLGFNLGNVIKYLARAGKKGDRQEDLKKARFYLNREIEKNG